MGELTVFNELAQVEQRGFFCLGDALDELHNTICDRFLELEAAFLPQRCRQETNKHTMFLRVAQAKLPDGCYNDNLELVGDFVHE